MAFDPGAAETVVKAHPIVSALGALAIVLVIWWALARGGSAPAAAPAVANDDSSTTAATAIQNAQIAAGVANNQTAASQTVALAQTQAATDALVSANSAATTQAYYGAATAIASSNNSTYVAALSANDGLAEQTNSTIAGEFTTLAGVINSLLGGTTQDGSSPKVVTGNVQDYDVVQGLLGALGSQSNAVNILAGGGPAPPANGLFWNSGTTPAFPGSSVTASPTGGGFFPSPNLPTGGTQGAINLGMSNLGALSNTGPEAHQ